MSNKTDYNNAAFIGRHCYFAAISHFTFRHRGRYDGDSRLDPLTGLVVPAFFPVLPRGQFVQSQKRSLVFVLAVIVAACISGRLFGVGHS